MCLHVETIGSGVPLLLIHGWGMHGGVWSDVAQRLAADFQVLCVDLPGYGYSKNVGWAATKSGNLLSSKLDAELTQRSDTHRQSPVNDGYRYAQPILQANLDTLVQVLSARFTEPLNVCGWSLGGQVAMHWAAREPDKVRRLILVASTPCFAERDDWMFGMPGDILKKFAEELEKNHAATLRRFISLQLRGSENERELLARLREELFSRGEPDMAALCAGLNILRDIDLRESLPSITQPTLVIAGERDKLTPPEASYYLAQVMSFARIVEVEGAAHAPFLSHPDFFVDQVKSFLHERI